MTAKSKLKSLTKRQQNVVDRIREGYRLRVLDTPGREHEPSRYYLHKLGSPEINVNANTVYSLQIRSLIEYIGDNDFGLVAEKT